MYLPKEHWHRIDVDNVLKKLMDALQGAVPGQGKKNYTGARVLSENDSQVYRAENLQGTSGSENGGVVTKSSVIPGRHRIHWAKPDTEAKDEK